MGLEALLAKLESQSVTPGTPRYADGVPLRPAPGKACTPGTPGTPKNYNAGSNARALAATDALPNVGMEARRQRVVEILATGDGLKLIDKGNPMTSEISKSLVKDVSFVACHASMKTNHMEDSQLAAGVGTVPSGGREMAARKAQGWAVLEDKSIK